MGDLILLGGWADRQADMAGYRGQMRIAMPLFLFLFDHLLRPRLRRGTWVNGYDVYVSLLLTLYLLVLAI
jgi:hypothetical protein